MTHHDQNQKNESSAVDDTAAEWQFDGTWNEFEGRVREVWGDLTDDEFEQAKGSTQKMLGVIQRKTGEGLESIQQKLSR